MLELAGVTVAYADREVLHEIDLVVPEFVRPTPAWQALPWYPSFTELAPNAETILMRPSPTSYVLIFPRSTPAAAPQSPSP